MLIPELSVTLLLLFLSVGILIAVYFWYWIALLHHRLCMIRLMRGFHRLLIIKQNHPRKPASVCSNVLIAWISFVEWIFIWPACSYCYSQPYILVLCIIINAATAHTLSNNCMFPTCSHLESSLFMVIHFLFGDATNRRLVSFLFKIQMAT